MAAGNVPTLGSVNNQAANLVIGLRNTLVAIQQFQAGLTATGSAGLVNLGMASGDAATMISAFNDLNDLAGVYFNGTSAAAHLTGTYQYSQFSKQLTLFI